MGRGEERCDTTDRSCAGFSLSTTERHRRSADRERSARTLCARLRRRLGGRSARRQQLVRYIIAITWLCGRGFFIFSRFFMIKSYPRKYLYIPGGCSGVRSAPACLPQALPAGPDRCEHFAFSPRGNPRCVSAQLFQASPPAPCAPPYSCHLILAARAYWLRVRATLTKKVTPVLPLPCLSQTYPRTNPRCGEMVYYVATW